MKEIDKVGIIGTEDIGEKIGALLSKTGINVVCEEKGYSEKLTDADLLSKKGFGEMGLAELRKALKAFFNDKKDIVKAKAVAADIMRIEKRKKEAKVKHAEQQAKDAKKEEKKG